MNRKRLFISAALFAVASVGFISCEEQFFDPTSVKGDLSVFLTDNSNGEVLTDATFSLLSGTEVITTNETGSFKGIPTGSYLLKVEKTGYATSLRVVQIGVGSGDSYLSHITINLNLYKLGAKLSGKAMYTRGTLKLPAVDAVLTLKIDDGGFAQKVYTATVAADGSYLFENLPEKVSVSVSSLVTIDGVAYQASEGFSLQAAEQEFTRDITYFVTSNLIASTPETVKLDENIVCTFTLPVDISRIKRIYATGNISGSYSTIMVSATWSDGNKTLTIANAAATAWPVTTLTIHVEDTETGGSSLYSITGASDYFAPSITVKNAALVGVIAGFTAGGNRNVPYSTDLDTLRWNVPTDSKNTHYRVYAKAENENAYKLLVTLVPDGDGRLQSSGPYKLSQTEEVITFERSFPSPFFSNSNRYNDYQIEAYNTVNVERSTVQRLTKPTVADILSFTADTIGTNTAKQAKFTWKVPADSITTHFKLYWKMETEPEYRLECTLRTNGSGAYTYENAGTEFNPTYEYNFKQAGGIISLESKVIAFDVISGSDFKIEAYNFQPNGTSVYSTSAKTFHAKRK